MRLISLSGSSTSCTDSVRTAHQIHYSLPWTKRVEHHPNVVVHAPLNLVLMLELYRSAHSQSPPNSSSGPSPTPTSIDYRAISPLYAGDSYTVRLSSQGEVWCMRDVDGGSVCLSGRIA